MSEPQEETALHIFIKFRVIEGNVVGSILRIPCGESPGQTNVILWLSVAWASTWGPYIEVWEIECNKSLK